MFVEFEENAILTIADLKLLSRDDYADLGVGIGPRNKIIHALRSENLSNILKTEQSKGYLPKAVSRPPVPASLDSSAVDLRC